jgi:glutamine synthetase
MLDQLAGGYGDYVMQPDLSTLRPVPWLEGTAMVLCDLLDHHTHKPVPQSPRQILKVQIARLKAMGFDAMMATELEFFLFEQSFRDLRPSGYRDLTPISAYNEDYHILQTTKEESDAPGAQSRSIAAGIPVENSKGEAEAGQEELNIRYADALACADHHTIAKHAVKEIAWAGPFGDLPAEVARRQGRQRQRMCTCRCGAARSPRSTTKMATTACRS